MNQHNRPHANVEGTFTLEGLIEGRVADLPDLLPRLEEWAEFARSQGVRFHLQTAPTGLSVLPEAGPTPVEPLGNTAHEAIGQLLRQMLEIIPPSERRNLFSTLRSEQFHAGESVQAVYLVQPDGSLQVETRTVPAETTAPPQPLSRAQRLRAVGIGLVGAAAILGILSLFVDVRAVGQQVVDTVRPLDAGQLVLETGPLEPYLHVAGKEIQRVRGNDVLAVHLERGPEFPLSSQELHALAGSDSLADQLAAHALARGYIQAELFDREGRYVRTVPVRIRPLLQHEAIELALPLPQRPRVTRIELTY